MRFKSILLTTLLLLFPALAHGQDWYTEYDNGGVVVGTTPLAPAFLKLSGYPIVAHYKFSGTSTTASNAINVCMCTHVVFTVYQSDADGTVGEIFVYKHPNMAKGASFKILGDYDGNGIVNEDDNVPMDGDEGAGEATGTAGPTWKQNGTMYDVTGLCYVSVAPDQAPESGDDTWVEAKCE